MAEEMELFAKELKAKFDDMVAMIPDDEEVVSLKKFTIFMDDVLDMFELLVSAVRINRENIRLNAEIINNSDALQSLTPTELTDEEKADADETAKKIVGGMYL